MLRKQEIRRGVESLIRVRTHWVKNNSLNFIDKISSERPLTKKQGKSLDRIKRSIQEIKVDYFRDHLNQDSIYKIKNLVLEIILIF